MTASMSDLRLGVDLGGTKTEAVVLELGSVTPPRELARCRKSTPQQQGFDAVVVATARLMREVAADAGVDIATIAAGLGMPGAIRRRDGLVKNSNTTCLNGRPFRQSLESLLGRPIAFDNDANCFALAEAVLGAGRGCPEGIMFGVIMGTGVGGGVVVGGKLWPGLQGIAGEWGHHALYGVEPAEGIEQGRTCYCGKRGCAEVYLSGPAVELDYERMAGAWRPLKEIIALRDVDESARAAVDTFLVSFGRGLANVIDILDPSMIVLGGGLSNMNLLYDEGVEMVRRCVFNDELLTPIIRHQLGDSAGVLGAALIAAPP